MREVIFFRDRGETKPPIFNPKESTLSLSNMGFPFSMIKGNGETKSIVLLYIQENSTAKSCSEKLLTRICNETASSENNSFLAKAFQSLNVLNQLPYNWDGYNAEKPNTKAIKQAESFFIFFEKNFSFLPNSLSNPNISANSEGDVVLEWWFRDKKLTIYTTPEQISYLKVAGERIEDMEDGILDHQNPNQLSDLFVWLIR